MAKSRLTLLLNEDQIRKLKVDAAANGMPVNQWVVENLLSDDVWEIPIINQRLPRQMCAYSEMMWTIPLKK